MKLKSLLVFGASMFMTTAANAWDKPVPATQDLITDGMTPQYLYNVDVDGFLIGSNNYSTRSSCEKGRGYQWKITLTAEETYSLTDHVEKGNDGKDKGWLKMFCDNNASIWVDNNSGANCDSWTLTKIADGKYKIGNHALPDEYLGCAIDNSADSRNYFTSYFDAQEPAIVAGYTWTGVSVEAYETYLEAFKVYDAAMKLEVALADIEATYPAVDVSSEKAVYNNGESTVEQLTEAAESVVAKKKKAVAEEAMASASLENPKDMTSMIVNPDFAENKGDGWSGTAFAFQSYADAEHFNKTYDTYQEIKDLPMGVYKVSTQAFYRAGDAAPAYTNFVARTGNNAKVYGANVTAEGKEVATADIMSAYEGILPNNSLGGSELSATDEDGTLFYIPNNMQTAQTYFNEGYYKGNSVMFPVSEGTANIGIQKSATITNDWTICNNFTLQYFGNAADAWGELMINYQANAIVDPTTTKATPSVVEAYNTLVIAATATNYESYKASVATIAEAKTAIDANVAEWAKYIAMESQANAITSDKKMAGIPAAQELAAYMGEYFEAYVKDDSPENEFYLCLTTEEITEEIKALQSLIENAQKSIPAGTDVTDKFIKNPKFAEGWANWEHSGTGTVAANAAAHCAEAWNSANFDIHQDLTNAPAGIYQVEVQGFYRYLRGDDAWLAYFNEDGSKKENPVEYIKNTPAVIYMNNNTAPMANVFDYKELANEDCHYAHEVKEGVLSFGNAYTDPFFKNEDTKAQAYAYPNNMDDAGKAFDVGAYKVSTMCLVKNSGDLLRIGMKGNSNQGGDSWAIFTRFRLVYQGFDAAIIKPELEKEAKALDLTPAMGSDVKAEGEAAMTAATSALAQEDGVVMFNALSDIYDVKGKIVESAALFANLKTQYGELTTAIGSSQAVQKTMEAAAALAQDVNDNMTKYTDEQAKEKLGEISSMIKKLSISSEIESASEENAFDMTAFIDNPSFESGMAGWTNLSGTGTQALGAQTNNAFAKVGNTYAERWHAAGDIDMNQVIYGLPTGTYILAVDAHASCGGYLYAQVAEKAAVETPFSSPEVSTPTAPVRESVVVYVTEGEPLKIGVKGTLTGDTWFAIDNFTLDCIAYEKDVTTGAEMVVEDAQNVNTPNKFFKNGQVLIMSNGKLFNVAGIQK